MKEFLDANRNAWNLAAPIHARHNWQRLLQQFSQPGYNCLDETITAILQEIGLDGKHVAQLCCNNGRELLSIKNLGAASVTGFDIADGFIRQAQQLAQASRIEAHFHCCSIYDIPASFDRQFDLLFISVGTLGWMPDLRGFFATTQRLLKPGGWLVLYEMHPLLDMFEGEDKSDPPPLRHSYFRTEPYCDTGGLDYYGFSSYESSVNYWFHHTLGDILQTCLEQDFSLQRFQEYPHDLSNVFAHFESMQVKPPLSYLLVAKRTGDEP